MAGIDAQTVFLLHCDGADGATTFPDASQYAHSTSRNGIKVDTGQSKFGGASAQFVGTTGQWITSPDSADWNFGAGDFTIDFWVMLNSTSDQFFIGQWDIVADNGGWYVMLSGGNLNFSYRDVGNGTYGVGRAWAPTTGVWYHIAISRNGANLRLFINGVKAGSTQNVATTQLFDSPNVLTIGSYTTSGNVPANAWMDEIRISKGVARWIADFTPPTAPYSATSVYNDTPSGGIRLGGSSASDRSLDLAPSGSIALSGSVALGYARAYTPSGGVVLGGSTLLGPAKLTVRLLSGGTVIASWTHPLVGAQARVSWTEFQMPLSGALPSIVFVGKAKLRLKAKSVTTVYEYKAVTGKATLRLKGKHFQAIEPNHMRPEKPKLILKGKPFVLKLTQRLVVGKPKLRLKTKPIARAGVAGLIPSPPHILILIPTTQKPGILVPTTSHGLTLDPTDPTETALVPTAPKSTLLIPTARRSL